MKISFLQRTLQTTLKQPKVCQTNNVLLSAVLIALVFSLCTGLCAQEQVKIKIVPKKTKKTTKPIVTVRPLVPAAKPSQVIVKPKPKPAPVPAPTGQALASGDIVTDVLLIVDGKVMNAGLIELIRGQQVMVWLRDLEKLGWGAISSDSSGQLSLETKNVKLTFKKNQDTAMVNSLAVKLPINTYMRDGKFMVPLSFVAKSLGHEYDCAYRPVVFVVTGSTPQQSAPANTTHPKVVIGNTISGVVNYNEKPVAGIKVRVTDKDMVEIEGAKAVTGADGTFNINNLPDGEYAAYVYTGDNPGYFNRSSEVIAVAGNQTFKIKPLNLGRILSGIAPDSGASVKAENGEIAVSWVGLDGVAEYRLNVKAENGEVLSEIRAKEAKTVISADKLTVGTKYTLDVAAYDSNGEFIGGTPGAGGKPWTFVYTDK